MHKHLRGLLRVAGDAGLRVLGTAAAILPARWWPALDVHVPTTSSVALSVIATITAAVVIGIPPYMRLAERGVTLLAFLMGTPAGWATAYLGTTGLIRALGYAGDDPFGDPVLTAIDALLLRGRQKQHVRSARTLRENLEGPEVPDRVVPGEKLGMPDVDFVIVSRAKSDWDEGTVLIGEGKNYRVGIIEKRTIAGRLRTLYPVTEHRDAEVFRRAVRYDINNASRGRTHGA
jgi:hypothetical protein